MPFSRLTCCRALSILLVASLYPGIEATAQNVVTGQVQIVGDHAKSAKKTKSNVVVWLNSEQDLSPVRPVSESDTAHLPRLVQKDKRFDPHILVVPVGSAVEFPNHDPFFHNVFSLFEGKRFDLGLYEAGSTRMVHFDQPGISYIFCNIHPQMSAVVIALSTRLYAVSDATGKLRIPAVPYGRYVLHAWSERALPESLEALTREITVGPDSASLGILRPTLTNDVMLAHKNKYGRDYDQPSPSNPIYPQP